MSRKTSGCGRVCPYKIIKERWRLVTLSRPPLPSSLLDVNAGVIVAGEGTIQSVGKRIFDEIMEVAPGKLMRAEILGHREFDIHTVPVLWQVMKKGTLNN